MVLIQVENSLLHVGDSICSREVFLVYYCLPSGRPSFS
jgi:hypothetical protein